MAKRVMPPPERFATCPNEGRILSYYEGTFEAVYVVLSPFIRPVGIPLEDFESDTYPDRRTVESSCQPVLWETARTEAGLPSIEAVDIGLRSGIGGLKRESSNRGYAERLCALLGRGILPPPEGEHPDLLHNRVLEAIEGAGHQWVWVGDEYGSERKLHWVGDLKREERYTITGHCNVFTPDLSLLWTVHWDSHFTFLCSSKEQLDGMRVAQRFEGFFCEPETEVYWSVVGGAPPNN